MEGQYPGKQIRKWSFAQRELSKGHSPCDQQQWRVQKARLGRGEAGQRCGLNKGCSQSWCGVQLTCPSELPWAGWARAFPLTSYLAIRCWLPGKRAWPWGKFSLVEGNLQRPYCCQHSPELEEWGVSSWKDNLMTYYVIYHPHVVSYQPLIWLTVPISVFFSRFLGCHILFVFFFLPSPLSVFLLYMNFTEIFLDLYVSSCYSTWPSSFSCLQILRDDF